MLSCWRDPRSRFKLVYKVTMHWGSAMIRGSLVQVPETQSVFHPPAQVIAFCRRDAHLQSRLRIAEAAGADRGPLKTQRESALRLLVQVPALRVFGSERPWPTTPGLFVATRRRYAAQASP